MEQWQEYLAIAGTVATLLGAMTKQGRAVLTWLWRKGKGVFGVYKKLEEHDHRLAEVSSQLTSIGGKLDIVVGELQVNGGNSIRDVFNTLLIDALAETGTRRAMHTDVIAFWESDKDGKCIFASNKLGELMDMNPGEVLCDGWITKLHPDDLIRVTHAWEMAVHQKRTFIADYRFVHDNGDVINVQGHCHPVVNSKKEIVKFIGILTKKGL